ncbi:MAG: nicotinate-nucleotide--dimethylbenzimidazole phosphoribosyltransferase [Coriobacteriales bacterium]|jgi:nicotinate-nucleotide--dimethylbenzimidazole phosphoribosyltransferase|nr:nicotinate-nucleotide--dimethylbenzimidazole phosphoribosyltransferase [Coriobacteriales bacterium]
MSRELGGFMSIDTTTADKLQEQIQYKIDNKTKPRGALGQLESLAAQLCSIQNTLTPVLAAPTIVVFAADHGLAREAISAYPREVSAQMTYNILAGGAGINVFAGQHNIEVLLVDAGIDWPEARPEGMIDHWMGPGTNNCLEGDALSARELEECLAAGASVVDHNVNPLCTVLGFGELGIGNTSSASLLMNALTDIPLPQCVGPGTGLVGAGLAKKLAILGSVRAGHPHPKDALETLQMFGGFEIAQMVGAMLRAFATGRILLIDGFVASAALLAANALNPGIIEHAIFCHQSGEPGHARLLDFLGAQPLIDLGMRLGEGSGCAVAYPLLVSAVAFLQNMASFEEAGVSTGEPEAQADEPEAQAEEPEPQTRKTVT